MIDTDKLKPNPFDPFIVIKEYVEWYPENAPAILQRCGTPSIKFAVDLLAEVKELRRQIKVARGVFEHLYDDELEDADWIRWFCNMEDEKE